MTRCRNQKAQPSARNAILVAGVAACATVATIFPAIAQSQDSVLVDVGACIELETREEQLECYESRVSDELRERRVESGAEETETATAADTATIESSREPAPPPRTETARPERDEPPASDNRREVAAAEPEESPSAAEDEIVATVTSLRELAPNTFIIYLDNDQVWKQNRPKQYRLSVGAEVRLRPTQWGTSYRLTDPNLASFIQVERIR